jgi:hypothetical protein
MKINTLLFILFISVKVFAQNNLTTTDAFSFSASGNAPDGLPWARFNENWGIRFNSPDPRWVFSSKPSVLIGYVPSGQNWGNDNLFVAGKIGIGTTTPFDLLHVNGNISIKPDDSNVPSYLNFKRTSDGWIAARIGQVYSRVAYGGHLIFETNGSANSTNLIERMRITYDGNVGIGTTIPDALLAVKGTIHSQEVKVDLNVPGPDYVFEPNYDLKPLSEIETYIKANKHLPEIPSAKEMEKNGVQLGEMNMLLLKKVEELTLYIIEKEKEFIELKSEVEALKRSNTKTKK